MPILLSGDGEMMGVGGEVGEMVDEAERMEFQMEQGLSWTRITKVVLGSQFSCSVRVFLSTTWYQQWCN